MLNDNNKWGYFKDKSILFAGGTGFIGKNLLKFLIEKNLKLKNITIITRNKDNFINNYPELQVEYLDFIETEISELTLNESDHSYDYIIYGATPVVETPTDVNKMIIDTTIGIRNLARFIDQSRPQALLNLSSGCVYGGANMALDKPKVETDNIVATENNCNNAYFMSKLLSETMLYSYAHNLRIPTLNFRCFSFGGAYLDCKHYALGEFIYKALTNQEINVKAGMNIFRSYLNIECLINCILVQLRDLSYKNKPIYNTYNIGSSKAISIPDLAFLVKNTLNSNCKINLISTDHSRVDYYIPDTNKIRKAMDYQFDTGLVTIIENIAQHYKFYYKL